MDAVTTYKLFAANTEKTLERLQSDPIIEREVAYYAENIGNVKTSEEFVEDSRLLKFALKAYGLEEMSYAKAFMKKVVDGGEEGFAADIADPKYKEFAADFDFTSFGSATTSFSKANEGVIDRFYQASIEQEAGDQNTGARLAIYFERKITEITDAYEIIGDRALFQVVQTAFALPNELALQDVDRQADIIADRLDLEGLQDPEKSEELISEIKDRFLNLWDINNPNTASIPPLVGLIGGGAQSLSLDLISSLQTIRR